MVSKTINNLIFFLFIVAPCILITLKFLSPTNAFVGDKNLNLIFVHNCEAHYSYRFISVTHTNISERDNGNVCKMPYPLLLLVTLESGINSVSSAG
jgi:hypothetical protein